ncbi:hypothetical protein [Pedobacter nutrimenti]|uniref:hypothetical protein n=1 Tax=Pedobacter nutrimenti TaxID=1241337 RepID=UPI00292E6BE2|nr:hypothetical protein [Pedobacter nutrimenti]
MFLNGDGEMVHVLVGGPEANGLIEAGKLALNPDKNLLSVIKEWNTGKRDHDFVVKYFKTLKEAYLNDQASADFLSFFNKENDKDKTSKSTFELIKIVGAAPFSPLLDYVEASRSKYYKSVGKQEIDSFISKIYLTYLESLSIYGARKEFDAAMKKFKLKKYPYTDEYEMYCNVYFAYTAKNDIKAYMERGTEFLAKYGRNNDAYTLGLTSLLGNYTGRPNEGAAGIVWMENLLKRNPDPSYLDFYFYILWRNYQVDKALAVGNQIRENDIKNDRPTKSIDEQIEMVKGIKAKASASQKSKS